MSDYYNLTREEMVARARFTITFVTNTAALNELATERVAETIAANNRDAKPSTFIFPVGPLQYESLAARLNREKHDLHNVTIFMMDE